MGKREKRGARGREIHSGISPSPSGTERLIHSGLRIEKSRKIHHMCARYEPISTICCVFVPWTACGFSRIMELVRHTGAASGGAPS